MDCQLGRIILLTTEYVLRPRPSKFDKKDLGLILEGGEDVPPEFETPGTFHS